MLYAKLSKKSLPAALILGMLLLAAAILVFSPRGQEMSFISRYVEELRAGYGFVFNPGERTLLLPYPLLIILLAFFGQSGVAVIASLLVLASWFSLARLGRTGLLLIFSSMVIWFILVVAASEFAFSFIGLEAALLWYGCGMLTFALSTSGRPILAGVMAGAALFAHPLTAVGLGVAAYLTASDHVWRFLYTMVAVLLLGCVLVFGYFGTGLGFGALQFTVKDVAGCEQGSSSFFQGNVIALLYKAWCNQFRPGQTIIFLDAPTQPDVRLLVERGDLRSLLLKYVPDMIFDSTLFEDVRLQQVWQVDASGIRAERRLDFGAFAEHTVTADYGPHLKIVGIGVDAANEDAIRVRLDWQIVRAATQPITIRLRFDGGTEVQDTFEPRVFRAGSYSTYHLLAGSRQAEALHVVVMINDGTAGDHALTLNTP